MKDKPLVFIASPYTKGDPCINARFQCEVFDQLMNTGLVWPYAPLISHFHHSIFPRPYKDWTDHDLAILARCDALLRLDAVYEPLDYLESESPGADYEESFARHHNIPIYRDLEGLLACVQMRQLG